MYFLRILKTTRLFGQILRRGSKITLDVQLILNNLAILLSKITRRQIKIYKDGQEKKLSKKELLDLMDSFQTLDIGATISKQKRGRPKKVRD